MTNPSLKKTRKTDSASLPEETPLVSYSISAAYDGAATCSIGTTREAFAAYALSASGSYVMPLAQPVLVRVSAASSPASSPAASSGGTTVQSSRAAASTVATGSTRAAYSYTWVKGVTVENNVITGNFWDANKVNPFSGGEDCNMCWAGSASNMIGWWQYYYAASYCTDSTVATSAQGILEVFKKNWQNEGGFADAGCLWWLAGGSDESDHYDQLYDDSRLTGAGTTAAGYYSRFYDTEKVHRIAYNVDAMERGAVELANEMVSNIDRGCILGINIWDPSDDGRHALTLWGITRNSSGVITELHFTDSNDGDDGQKRMVKAHVRYDSGREAYVLTDTYDVSSGKYTNTYSNWVLEDYDVLSPFEFASVIKPKSLKVTQSGAYAAFRWSGEQRKGMLYQIGYKLTSESKYTYVKSSSRSLSVSLPSQGTYKWAVRALDKDGKRALTAWSWGAEFSYDATPPRVSISGPYLKTLSGGRTSAEFVWSANEAATYKLAINGKVIYSGKGTSRTVTLRGLSNRYTLKATDAKGNASVYRGTISCAGGKPTTPRPVSFQVLGQGRQVSFSWSPASSSRSVTYEIRLKGAGSKRYIYRRGFTSTRAVINFSSMKKWSWAVRAVDSNGYYSAWRAGRTFNNDRQAPTLKLGKVVQTKKAAGRTTVTFTWSADEKSTFYLYLNGKRYYRGASKKRSVTLRDGYYNYTIYARDAAGNRSRKTGSFRCDTVAPARPTGLTLQLYNGGQGVTFNWNSVQDVSGVTYEIAIKTTTSSSYSYYKSTTTSSSFTLNVSANWKWAICAVDGRGNRSSWRFGSSFSNWGAYATSSARKASATAAKKSSVALDRELAVSSGASALSQAAGAVASACTAASALTGSTGQAEADKKYGLLAAS